MALGHSEIVHLLLDNGADISLAHSFWHHVCKPVHRDVYVEVTSALEELVAARNERKVEA
jgi:serum/glucocorticoid-regulated kinase 2